MTLIDHVASLVYFAFVLGILYALSGLVVLCQRELKVQWARWWIRRDEQQEGSPVRRSHTPRTSLLKLRGQR